MKQWLDHLTGAVTMYKLVLIMLTIIATTALLLSLFGQLGSYGPLALLASAAVAIGVTLGSTWLIARLLRVTPHLDSAWITGLLVFLIMQPKLDPLGLSGIAIAAVVASASKFLIAVRGRHVFNPAALGAFVVSIIVFSTFIGFSFAVWWVGTAYLLPAVAIGSFLVLYRTQRLTMGVAFVAVAAIVGIGGALLRGATAPEALSQAFLSSPLIFFAGFMLSEPLTLPPRRWQQLLEASVVALLFVVPFSVGPLSNTPQFALLVGNLLAFFFGQRRGIRLTYLGKRQLGPTTWELSFQPAASVGHAPGQYMELTIPHRGMDLRGSRRYFSISSAPTNDGPITFALTVPAKPSSFKQALLDLEPGATVHGTSVAGDFTLPKDVAAPLLLVAGGIGITPFTSQLAHARARGEQRDIVLVYATSTGGTPPYGELLQHTGARVVLFAPEPPKKLPKGWSYAGAGRVDGERLAAAVPDVAARRTYISGPPALVNDLRRALRSQGARHVHSDYFSGY
jgi:ferredoxin-NADP reductase